MKILKQICVKDYEFIENNEYHKLEKGKVYMTSIPKVNKNNITVYTKYFINAPKENFIVY